MAGPSVTYNTAGNALASQALGASASVSFTVDFSTSSYGGWLQAWNTGGGTVAATNGLQAQILAAGDTTPNYDTIALFAFTITTIASATNRKSILLPTGKYNVKLTNLDATNGITVVASSAALG